MKRSKLFANTLQSKSGLIFFFVLVAYNLLLGVYLKDFLILSPILVLPYPSAEYLNNKESFHDYYTDVEISRAASMPHPKSAIQIRNCEMVDIADLIIGYIEHKKGSAWQTIEYAKKQGKVVISVADEHKNNSKLFEKNEENH